MHDAGQVGIIVARLAALAESMHQAALGCSDESRSRYILSSEQLVQREHDRLADAVHAGDEVAVAWSLRSVGDMMKGLVDIGSNLPTVAPASWQEAKNIASEADRFEHSTRST